MKKLLFLSALLPLFTSCDQVDINDRYIQAEEIQVGRKVLLEEFTGQRCVNCPEAHEVIKKLQEQYGDDLVVVSINAGQFGIKAPTGLMQEDGNAYADRWNITAYPAGVVDRTSGVLNSDQWSTYIREEAGKKTDLEVNLSAALSEDGETIDITTNLLSSQALKGNLQLWVVENGIVALQFDGDERITDYVHNNVFRACVNGLSGQEISLSANVEYDYENSIAVQRDETYKLANWNTDNLYIVGFVYDSAGVIQVEKVKVSTGTSSDQPDPEE